MVRLLRITVSSCLQTRSEVCQKEAESSKLYSLVMCLCILDSDPFTLYLGEDKQIKLAQIIVLVLFSGYLCISTFCIRRNLGFSLLRGAKEDRV